MRHEICSRCKRPFTKAQLDARRTRHSNSIKEAAARNKSNGEPWGRPRISDYDEVKRLRKNGLSIQKIADQLKISKGSVEHALRKP